MKNSLRGESSKYLLQHANNPVHWYAWGDEPFDWARRYRKPVLVSIGYASCHWCHVMERESFEDHQTAAYMNEHFVCIKVDREEHPEVDQFYMNAVQALTGMGGWPLNVFTTPDRIPFYGGTYFPGKPLRHIASWRQVLERIVQVWEQENDQVVQQAQDLTDHLRQQNLSLEDLPLIGCTKDHCVEMVDRLLQNADHLRGGFGGVPKFPSFEVLHFLLEHYHFTSHKAALIHVLTSIDALIYGGIYDQIGGGIFRYATDENWKIPHFEKMLTDNSQFILILCDAWQVSRNPMYRKVIREIVNFLLREMKSPEGLFFSSLDADSEGQEGHFYTWDWEEWIKIVPEKWVADYFNVLEDGNWQGTNILYRADDFPQSAQAAGFSESEFSEQLQSATRKIAEVRSHRVRPEIDDGCIMAGNALVNLALAKAGAVLGDDHYQAEAEEHMKAIFRKFYRDGWRHIPGRPMKANLDDYAFLISALLFLGSLGRHQWLHEAVFLTTAVLEKFSWEDEVFFRFSSEERMPAPGKELFDTTTPSGNAVMAENLLKTGLLKGNSEWISRARRMLGKMTGRCSSYPYVYGYWGLLLQRSVYQEKIIVCTGSESVSFRKSFNGYFLPEAFVIGSEMEKYDLEILQNKYFSDQTLIFVCTEQACFPPVDQVEKYFQKVLRD